MRTNGARRLLVAWVVALVLGAGAASPLAQSRPASSSTTPTEVSRSIAKKFLAVVTAKTTSKSVWSSLYAPNIVTVDGGSGETTVGLDSNLRMWRDWVKSNPGLHITGRVWCAGPDWAAVVVTEQTPTMLHHAVGIEKIRNGLIVREIDYFETTSR